MKLTSQQLRVIRRVLRKNDVKRAHLFGSYARGDAHRKSDVDLLIEFRGSKSLFDLSGLKIDLEDSLSLPVDVVTYRSLRQRLLPYVKKDMKPLLRGHEIHLSICLIFSKAVRRFGNIF